MIEFFLNQYRWYRRFKGGIWWFVDVRPLPSLDPHWINRHPYENETIITSEDYTYRHQHVFADEEFYQGIANIPRNGEWRDDLNLGTYLKTAQHLRSRGVEDRIIIEILMNVYKAAAMEKTTSLVPHIYEGEELQALLRRIQA